MASVRLRRRCCRIWRWPRCPTPPHRQRRRTLRPCLTCRRTTTCRAARAHRLPPPPGARTSSIDALVDDQVRGCQGPDALAAPKPIAPAARAGKTWPANIAAIAVNARAVKERRQRATCADPLCHGLPLEAHGVRRVTESQVKRRCRKTGSKRIPSADPHEQITSQRLSRAHTDSVGPADVCSALRRTAQDA